ncbi:MAG: glycosyltransferase [Ruminococcaceae bacterium]|nr:glycosyltransferase [Oscillospiraceae bacterium]
MKVLHILQSNSFSGAENVVFQIITGLRKNGVESVYCSRDGQIRKFLTDNGIDFEPVYSMSKKEISRVIDKVKPDVIHAHDRSASLLSATCASKIPIVVHMHVNNNKGISLLIKNAMWTLFSRKFNHIFWVSKSSFDGFQFRGLLKKKSSVLYNVMDGSLTIGKAEEETEQNGYDVLYVGRLTHQKNPERLMSVIKSLCEKKNDIRIAIAGSGDYAGYVETFIADYNLENQVDYLGYTNKPLPLIKRSKAMIMTSRFEGTPMVAIEAQILGTPIVSTPVDGMLDVIENGVNGFLSDKDEELVERILDILSDDTLREKLRVGCIEKSKRFTDIDGYCDVIYSQYITAIEKH